MIRVVLADDHAVVRKGVRALIDEIPGVEVVGEAGDGREALRLITETRPDVAVLDISMPGLNGLEVTSLARKRARKTRILLITIHREEAFVRRAVAAGASGFVLKESDTPELAMAISIVARGGVYLSPLISGKLDAGSLVVNQLGDKQLASLTPRQREVLQLLAEGNSVRAIAKALSVSPKTVETHRSNLMDKLDIHDLAGLVRFAIREGLISA